MTSRPYLTAFARIALVLIILVTLASLLNWTYEIERVANWVDSRVIVPMREDHKKIVKYYREFREFVDKW